VLETLRPSERTVFVLREVFDVPYGQITGIYAIANPRKLTRLDEPASWRGEGQTGPLCWHHRHSLTLCDSAAALATMS
jgi:hypothetical protein